MTIEYWKAELEKEAALYGLTFNDVFVEDHIIENNIFIGWSPKDEMDSWAEEVDLVKIKDYLNKSWAGF